jgi:hypothetical protein
MIGLERQRAYVLAPLTTTPEQPGLRLGGDGRFTVPAANRGTRFTVGDVGPDGLSAEHWIIRVDEKDGSRCLSARDDGSLGLARCGPADAGQRFELRAGPDDSYGVVNVASKRWLSWNLRPGTRPTMTTEPATSWNFVDVGPSTAAG